MIYNVSPYLDLTMRAVSAVQYYGTGDFLCAFAASLLRKKYFTVLLGLINGKGRGFHRISSVFPDYLVYGLPLRRICPLMWLLTTLLYLNGNHPNITSTV